MLFIGYPKCSTCINAHKHLLSLGYTIEYRDIKLNKPTLEEIKQFHQRSGLDIQKLFNTSGLLYRKLKLKDKLPSMTLDEKYQLLASDGMLVKRPIIVLDETVYFGFKKDLWTK